MRITPLEFEKLTKRAEIIKSEVKNGQILEIKQKRVINHHYYTINAYICIPMLTLYPQCYLKVFLICLII